MGALIDLTGRRFGRLVVVRRDADYQQPNGARQAKWLCACDCGEWGVFHGGHLRRGLSTSCGCRRADTLRELGTLRREKQPTYSGMHQRIRADRGSAKKHQCVDCGAPASDWSYDHGDPDEIYEKQKNGMVFAYSPKPEHYVPRCRPCHIVFDRDRDEGPRLYQSSN